MLSLMGFGHLMSYALRHALRLSPMPRIKEIIRFIIVEIVFFLAALAMLAWGVYEVFKLKI